MANYFNKLCDNSDLENTYKKGEQPIFLCCLYGNKYYRISNLVNFNVENKILDIHCSPRQDYTTFEVENNEMKISNSSTQIITEVDNKKLILRKRGS